jgi:GntR family transcriptional regulator
VARAPRRAAPSPPPALGPGGGFLYQQLSAELRRRIVQGVYGPGSRIPSEADLVREFRVSAITVRRTIRDLQFEGLLSGRQGRGVFVADKRRVRRSLSGDATTPLRDEMRRAGVEPGVKVLALSLVPGPAEVRQRLQVAAGVPIHQLDTLILADGEPVGLDTTYLRHELGDALRAELSEEFIYPLSVSRGIPVDHMDFAIEGDTAAPAEAARLGLPVGFPVLVVHYTALSPDGAAIFTGRTATRADRFTYEFCRNPKLHVAPPAPAEPPAPARAAARKPRGTGSAPPAGDAGRPR